LVELPEVLLDRIVASVQEGLPAGSTVRKVSAKSVVFECRLRARVVASQEVPERVFSRIELIDVSEQDGLNPRSIAWVVRHLLETYVRMARSIEMPWPRSVAASMRAFAKDSEDSIRCWITIAGEPDMVFPPISLDGI